jgi:hypothetical protein
VQESRDILVLTGEYRGLLCRVKDGRGIKLTYHFHYCAVLRTCRYLEERKTNKKREKRIEKARAKEGKRHRKIKKEKENTHKKWEDRNEQAEFSLIACVQGTVPYS